MNEPVTCIIPVRNGAATIERAVTSAIAAGCDYVYIFDDASTDDTDHILYEMEKRYHHDSVHAFSLGQPVRAGVNFARNFLIEEVELGLIIPLDADDTLRNIKPFKQAYRPNTWVYGNYAEHDGDSIAEIKGASPGALPRKNITGVTFLFHKNDWLRAGGYNPDFAFAEDYAFQVALVNIGVHPQYVDVIGYDRYLHPNGNERTVRAGMYWTFYRDMARSRYPAAFKGTL